MSPHHGQQRPDEILDLGPTGKFPKGKLNADDEGELRFAIAADKERQKVLLDFGKSVKWIAMDPSLARDLAKQLIDKAELAESLDKS